AVQRSGQVREDGSDGRGQGNVSGLTVLRLRDGEDAAFEVHVTPAQPEQLSPAKTCLKKDGHSSAVLITREGLHQTLLLVVREVGGAAARLTEGLELAYRVRACLIVANSHVEDTAKEREFPIDRGRSDAAPRPILHCPDSQTFSPDPLQFAGCDF